MNIVIAPDKFKGSLTSFQVVDAIREGLQQPGDIHIQSFPFADGGDGFAAVMKYYLDTDTVDCDAVDPLGRVINVSYEWEAIHKTAIIEMAVASGLVLLKEEEKNPLKTSTFGTGLIIKHAIEKGSKKIVLGLGGSATNDAGMGILSALNFHFADDNGNLLQASGENLLAVRKIIPPAALPMVKFEIACDVQNTLYGLQGAAYIYAPQKGADKEAMILLDNGLKNFASIVEKQTGKDIANIPGTGAAGGIAAGLMAFFDVRLSRGVELIANANEITTQLAGVDLLITGEGKIDNQSSEGKVTGYMAALAKQHNIPCVAVCGLSSLSENEMKAMGIKKIVALAANEEERQFAIDNAATLLQQKAIELLQ